MAKTDKKLAKNKQYWSKRFKAVEAMNHQTAQKAVSDMLPAFDRAERQIQREIEIWYQRFADNNGISLTEAKKMLSARDLEELKWDIDEYIKYGKKNAIDGKWMKELENASARYHISRLEALQIRTQQAAEVAFGNETDQLDKLISQTYTQGYYHTAYEIQKGVGIGFDIGTIDQRKLAKLMQKPWTADGMTFSDRIWRSKSQLLDSVSKELTQMCILGKAPDDAIKNISKRMGVSKQQAGRLVMTESAYFASASQRDCYKDLDVEEFEIVATLDSHTSEICQDMDGKHFPMKDFEPGVTAPPFHVWCRSTTVPYFNDEFTADDMRWARGEDGKTYQVPADLKYEDWNDAFVKGNHEEYNEYIEPISNMKAFKLKNQGESGIIDIEIDEYTPCLKRVSDGKIVNTSFTEINPANIQFKDWEFDWTKPSKDGYKVFALKAEGDSRIQGLISIKEDRKNYAMHIGLVEAAPFNNRHNKHYVEKEYVGVGGHLFAEAVKQSYEMGYGGFVFFEAKTKLIHYYERELGAIQIGSTQNMCIEESAARSLFLRYYGGQKND